MPQEIIEVCGMTLEVHHDSGGGRVVSGLMADCCPSCNQPDCYFRCDGSQFQSEEEVRQRLAFNQRVEVIERLILAHACAGIDVTSPAYQEGIETVCDALSREGLEPPPRSAQIIEGEPDE